MKKNRKRPPLTTLPLSSLSSYLSRVTQLEGLGKSKKKLASSLYINAEKAAEKRKMREETRLQKNLYNSERRPAAVLCLTKNMTVHFKSGFESKTARQTNLGGPGRRRTLSTGLDTQIFPSEILAWTGRERNRNRNGEKKDSWGCSRRRNQLHSTRFRYYFPTAWASSSSSRCISATYSFGSIVWKFERENRDRCSCSS
jgi:hypothetical protein